MRYKLLGKSGLRVSELALGTMTFGEDWGFGANEPESRKQFDAFAEAGGNFIDTANVYTNGTSEKYLGTFLKGQRDTFIVATKYSGALRPGDVNSGGNHRKSMVPSVERSLRQLQTDYIDLLWVHVWDGSTPVDEVVRSLDALVRSGKVLHIGVSDWPAWVVSQAHTMAELRGWASFAALQIEYSLVQRTPERDLIPMAEAFGIGVTPWSPLGGGVLSGKYTSLDDFKKLQERRQELFFDHTPEQVFALAKSVVAVAKQVGKSPTQVALNWLRYKNTIPILGARDISQLKDSLAATEWELTAEQMAELDEASHIPLGFPHDFLRSAPVRNYFYAGVRDKVDWQNPPNVD